MLTRDRSSSLASTLKNRRQRLSERVDFPVILWSGSSSPRNFPANKYPFRASSHFLYFAGLPLENAAIYLNSGRLELFMDEPGEGYALWHGEPPKRDAIAEMMGADAAYPTIQLKAKAEEAATIPAQDAATRLVQSRFLNRMLTPVHDLNGIDQELAKAIVALRLIHDELALAEMRRAAAISVEAHRAGIAATRHAGIEAQIRAAIEGVMLAHNATPAYASIVTVHGEVLHNDQYHHAIQPDDLVLVDAGAEVESGWAADVTRTWAASGKFSPTQRAIYDVVLAAHDACIAAMRPGVEYRDIHLLGAATIAEGLADLGILKGKPEYLVERDAHALFFPHGIGHLLGLDVHDMEDLGDLAGYAEGRVRSDRFGLNYLRLNRLLQPGMVVTIEPGFYQVPAILNDPGRRATYQGMVNWERLAEFADVHGIRIEDDVLVTETGTEVLTAALPTKAEAIESIV